MALEMTYITVSGHRIVFEEPTLQLREFLSGVAGDAHDMLIDESRFIEEIWAQDNPIMGEGIIPERPVITRETVRHPLYRVFLDLIDRKHITQNNIDVKELASGFTMSVSEAAAELDVHVSAVRQLCSSFRIPSWYRGGAYWLRPESVMVYRAWRSQRGGEGIELTAEQGEKLRGISSRIKSIAKRQSSKRASKKKTRRS